MYFKSHMPPDKMCRKWIFFGFALQLLMLFLFYRLFFEERTFIIYNTMSEKFPNPAEVKGPKGSIVNGKLQKRTESLTIGINWNKIPRKSPPPAEEMHEKWIVVTTINSPTADVKKLAGIEGWKVVVVGDTKTPEDWRYVYNLFLSLYKRTESRFTTSVYVIRGVA